MTKADIVKNISDQTGVDKTDVQIQHLIIQKNLGMKSLEN